MLDTETKRRIDSCRDILVGKVPDPKSQVEQITIALIYKFMDDMDKQSVAMGGKASFFTGEYEKYSWSQIFNPRLGGFELIALYSDALVKINQNPKIPLLFRDIFKNAFLPYRNPETLKSFLKEINTFEYDHSERLGDAFEYLLSVMSSQGDAGQFRTPRHIIDFIVEVVDPQKNDLVLDPACGTAGFLISAYKHIIKYNPKMSSTEKSRLIQNFVGYDISPDMVRLSLVNLYLHGFVEPHIYEYDTLSSEDHWGDTADVILANPPFMTPKGGIKPHKRFSIQAKRSEVLFVDYIAEHLTPQGRAGVIVPEGIIFLSQKAYKKLRKMLIEQNYLWAVISLPAGVFNPYSNVKTSILLMDRQLAKKTDKILFVKIENDGFDLGAQRRSIEGGQLGSSLEYLQKYKMVIIDKKEIEETDLAHAVTKEEILASDDISLSGDRYRDFSHHHISEWPMVELGEVIELNFGTRITKKNDEGTQYPVYGGGGESFRTNNFNRKNELILSRFAMSPECVRYVSGKFFLLDSGFTYSIAKTHAKEISKNFVDSILLNTQDQIYGCARGHAQKNLDVKQFKAIKIPLPPLEVQEKIVAEIDGYQKVIDGARQVVENYKPTIKINPDWPIKRIGEVCDLATGGTPSSQKIEYYENGKIPWLVSGDIHQGEIFDCENRITEKGMKNSNAKFLPVNSVLIALNGQGKTRGTVALLRAEATCNQSIVSMVPNQHINLMPEYLYYVLKSMYQQIRNITGDKQRSGLSMRLIKDIRIPIASLDIQNILIADLTSEQAIVEQNKKLIELFETKIHNTIDEVWGAASD
ncbi:MAG TPA: restriction endonuclease subunit S [Phycisphaerales bacterium]|nr:restriction endonuclease subunit S [Phycisphaerales bacterium]